MRRTVLLNRPFKAEIRACSWQPVRFDNFAIVMIIITIVDYLRMEKDISWMVMKNLQGVNQLWWMVLGGKCRFHWVFNLFYCTWLQNYKTRIVYRDCLLMYIIIGTVCLRKFSTQIICIFQKWLYSYWITGSFTCSNTNTTTTVRSF